jgi:LmbE family N-acetylglucosaminyl deacetylase
VADGFRPEDFAYYDLRRRTATNAIDTLFPGWRPGDERVVVFSPHDDDALIGAGYLILAARANGGEVSVVIFCDGRAGYSDAGQRGTIVETRRRETASAFERAGITRESTLRLDYADFSAWSRMGWQLPGGQAGSFAATLPYLRSIRATRVLVPNGYREHADHEAVARIGAYDVPQVGDPILVDWGRPSPIRSLLEYAVWSDFGPEDSLVAGAPPDVRANRAIAAPGEAEAAIAEALREFRSQLRIIDRLLESRPSRRLADGRYLEAYRWFDPRPHLDYQPYVSAVEAIEAATPGTRAGTPAEHRRGRREAS